MMRFGFVFIFLCTLLSLTAQESVDTSTTYPGTRYFSWQFPAEFHELDTTALESIQRYHPAQIGSFSPGTHLGDIGQPTKLLLYDNQQTLGLDYGLHAYDAYKKSIANVRFYDTPKAYSHIRYVQAAQDENKIQAEYTRNFGKYANLALDYNKIRHTGAFANQASNHTNIGVSSWWRNKRDGYRGYTFLATNMTKQQENGGITFTKDSLEALDLDIDPSSIPVVLSGAKLKEFQMQAGLKQYFRLQAADSSSSKSTDKFLVHAFDYQGIKNTYEDVIGKDSSLIAYYGLLSQDSSDFYRQLEGYYIQNSLSFNFGYVNKRDDSLADYSSNIDIGIRHKYFEHTHNKFAFESGNELFAFGTLYQQNKKSTTKASLQFGYLDSREEFEFVIDKRYNVHENRDLTLGVHSTYKRPNTQQVSFYSNDDLVWSHKGLSHTENASLKAVYGLKRQRVTLSAKAHFLNDYVYIDGNLSMRQSPNMQMIFQFGLGKNFNVGKFHLDNVLHYQYLSNSKVLNLPNFISSHQLYFKNKVIKNRMWWLIGTSLDYTNKYKASAYHPGLSNFYQSTTELPSVISWDAYTTIKVQRFALFVKAENINQAISASNSYFLTPSHPMRDFTIRFGVNWGWFDNVR